MRIGILLLAISLTCAPCRLALGQAQPLRPVDSVVTEGVPRPAPTLTLEDLEAMGLQNNPALAAAGARIEALRGKWVQAGLMPNPVGGYVGSDIGEDGTDGRHGGIISQKLILGGKLRLNRAVVSEEIAQAEQLWAAQRQRVLSDVRTHFYRTLIAQYRRSLALRLVAIGKNSVRTAEQLLEAREAPRTDLLQAQIELERLQIALVRAENAEAKAWRELTAVVALPGLAPQPLAGDVKASAPDLTWDAAMQHLLSCSPEIAAAAANVQRAGVAVRRARAEVVPDVNADLAVQHQVETGDTVTTIGAAFPWPLWNRNQGGIAQAEAEYVEASRNLERVELQLQQRLAAEFQIFADARLEVERYSQQILPNANKTTELVNQAYAAGELGYLELLTAQRTYFRANLDYVEALERLHVAGYRIEGLLLYGSLDSY